MIGITILSKKETKDINQKRDFRFALSSDAFRNGGIIPPVYTCRGQGISPRLSWNNVPEGTRSFVVILEDPDAPSGTFSHWVVYNIPSEKRELPSSFPLTPSLPDGTRQGMNDFRKIGYGAPCPPHGKPHRYRFRIFAVDTLLSAETGKVRTILLEEIKDHTLGIAELTGLFER